MELGNWCCTSNNCVYHSKALGLVNRYRMQKKSMSPRRDLNPGRPVLAVFVTVLHHQWGRGRLVKDILKIE